MSFITTPPLSFQTLPVTLQAASSGPYIPGTGYNWTITDFDSYQTYTISTSNGTITRSVDVLTFTPNSSGAVSFIVNGRSVSLTTASVPDAPTIGTATVVDGSTATVSYTAPASNGGSPITSYTATSSPGGITGTISQAGSGTITVSGLTGGTTYTFTVKATNAVGTSAASQASNSITPPQESIYTTPGTYTWVAPTGVTNVSSVVMGGGGGGSQNHGGGGGGGGLVYVNNQSTTPGNSYAVVVGSAGTGGFVNTGGSGGASQFGSTIAYGGNGGNGQGGAGGSGGGFSGGTAGYTGGTGGAGFLSVGSTGGGGGGVGGYTGNGGTGAYGRFLSTAGGAGSGSSPGTGGAGGATTSNAYGVQENGYGWVALTGSTSAYSQTGYGAGGGGGGAGGGAGANGIAGAVRIVWPGTSKQFPNTNVS
jgi:hypothetical protein